MTRMLAVLHRRISILTLPLIGQAADGVVYRIGCQTFSQPRRPDLEAALRRDCAASGGSRARISSSNVAAVPPASLID